MEASCSKQEYMHLIWIHLCFTLRLENLLSILSRHFSNYRKSHNLPNYVQSQNMGCDTNTSELIQVIKYDTMTPKMYITGVWVWLDWGWQGCAYEKDDL